MSLLRVLHEVKIRSSENAIEENDVLLRSTEVASNCTEVERRITEVASEDLY